MLKNLSIKKRLKLFSSLIISIQVCLAAFIFSQLVAVEHHVKTVAHNNMPAIEKISAVTELQLEQEILFEQAFKLALEVVLELKTLSHFEQVTADFLTLNTHIEQEITHAHAILNQARQNTVKISEKRHLEETTELLALVKQHHESWQQHITQIFTQLRSGDIKQAEALSITAEEEALTLRKETKMLLSNIETLTEHSIKDIEQETLQLEKVTLIASGLAILIMMTGSILIIRMIRNGLEKADKGLSLLASGDFSQGIKTDEPGEIGRLLTALETMRLQVSQLLQTVQHSAAEVNDAAGSLAAVSEQVQVNTHLQAEEVCQISTAMNELASTTHEVANHSVNTQSSATSAAECSGQTLEASSHARELTQELITNLNNSSHTLMELEKNSEDMSVMLEVIKGVAEQTNLLALNAAIEAARAGEQGRGFAVVADEVRQLAMRTQQSAEEISGLIERFRATSRKAAQAMKQNSAIGEKTVFCSDNASQRLQEVNSAIVSIRDMNIQIASAAEQQSCVVEEVNRSMNQVNQTVEEGASMVDQIAAACQQLSGTSQQLKAQISSFRLS